MATELRYTEEARQWFTEGTKTVMVSFFMSACAVCDLDVNTLNEGVFVVRQAGKSCMTCNMECSSSAHICMSVH